jgi:hypothetical protein
MRKIENRKRKGEKKRKKYEMDPGNPIGPAPVLAHGPLVYFLNWYHTFPLTAGPTRQY